MTRVRAVKFALFVLVTAFALSGCNTVRGFGQDVKKAGSELEEAAEEAKN